MADTRSYNAPWLDLAHLAATLEGRYRAQGFETQTINVPGGLTIQARSKKFFEYGVALNVMLLRSGDTLQAQVGTGKWILHAAQGVAALIIFWPLLALPAYAAYKLKENIDETWRYLEGYVAARGQVEAPGPFAAAPAPAPSGASEAPAASVCPQCGKPVKPEARFCGECGAKLLAQCPQCGAPLTAGAKFCASCGTPLIREA
jgi:hypothetical protein